MAKKIEDAKRQQLERLIGTENQNQIVQKKKRKPKVSVLDYETRAELQIARNELLGFKNRHKTREDIKAKLAMSRSNDPCEIEADSVAEKILSMNESEVQKQAHSSEGLVQAKQTGTGTKIPAGVESDIANLSGGKPLSESERAYYEPRFGTDFSGVKVHDDVKAHEMAAAIDARAFTIGNNVVFGKGERSQGTEGKKLMAHELVHVVQQGVNGTAKSINRVEDLANITWQYRSTVAWNAQWQNMKVNLFNRTEQEWRNFLPHANEERPSLELNAFMAAAIGRLDMAFVGWERRIRNVSYSVRPDPSNLQQSAINLMRALLTQSDMVLALNTPLLRHDGSLETSHYDVRRAIRPLFIEFCNRFMPQVLSEMSQQELSSVNTNLMIYYGNHMTIITNASEAAIQLMREIINVPTSGTRRQLTDNRVRAIRDRIRDIGRIVGNAATAMRNYDLNQLGDIRPVIRLIAENVNGNLIIKGFFELLSVFLDDHYENQRNNIITDQQASEHTTATVNARVVRFIRLIDRRANAGIVYWRFEAALEAFSAGLYRGRLNE